MPDDRKRNLFPKSTYHRIPAFFFISPNASSAESNELSAIKFEHRPQNVQTTNRGERERKGKGKEEKKKEEEKEKETYFESGFKREGMAIARFDNNPLNGSRWLSATRFERRRIGETILRYRSVTSAIATLRTFLLPLNFLLCVWRARRTVTRRFGLIRLIRLQARRIARADGSRRDRARSEICR